MVRSTLLLLLLLPPQHAPHGGTASPLQIITADVRNSHTLRLTGNESALNIGWGDNTRDLKAAANHGGKKKGSVAVLQSDCWTGSNWADPPEERNTIFLGGIWNNSAWEKVPGSRCEGWELAVKQAAARVAELSLAGVVDGVFFGDELSCDNKVPFAVYAAVTSAFRAALDAQPGGRRIFLYTNECHRIFLPSWGGYWPQVPPALDFISLDHYNLSNPAAEADGARALYETELYPRLNKTTQRAVPGTFAPLGKPAAETFVVTKLQRYAAWAEGDPLLVGWCLWHWFDGPASLSPLQQRGASSMHAVQALLTGDALAPPPWPGRRVLKAVKSSPTADAVLKTDEFAQTALENADSEEAVLFFVAPDGADAATGTKAAPFRTLRHAQSMARRMSSSPGAKPRATIYLRAGVYSGPENVPLEFTTADSGTVWESYQGEEVLLSGGVALPDSAFTPHPTLPGVSQANLTALGVSHSALGIVGGNESTWTTLDRTGRYGKVGAFAELFYQGQAMQLARWPNMMPDDVVNYSHTAGGYGFNCSQNGFTCEGNCTGFSMPNNTLSVLRLMKWEQEAKSRDPWLLGFFTWDFDQELVKLTGVDAAARGLIVGPGKEVCKSGARITAVNLLSELDVESEYYIERSNRSAAAAAARGMLYFRKPLTPAAGGTHGTFVSVAQSVISFASDTSAVTLKGLRLEHSRGSAVVAYGAASNITVSNCTIANTGASGIEFVNCTNCLISGCELFGMAAAGINVAGGRHDTLRRGDNVIRDNRIHHYARWHRDNMPGILWQGVGNTFAGNVIHNSPAQAFMGGGASAVCGDCTRDHRGHLVCGDFDYDIPCGANDNVFESNWIYNVTRECTDCGQFYSCGQVGAGYNQRGNVFRNNRMEDSHKHVFSNGHFGNMQVFAFYLDDTMSGWVVENNTFVSCDIGVLFNGGRDNIVRGNNFERIGHAVQLVDECPGGAITMSNLYRGYTELQRTAKWPAWDKYNLSHFDEPSGNLPIRALTNISDFYPLTTAGTFMNWSCSAGGNYFSENTYCNMTGVFCRGYDTHKCTRTTSVFVDNRESCEGVTSLKNDDGAKVKRRFIGVIQTIHGSC